MEQRVIARWGWRRIFGTLAAAALIVPAVAMQLSPEVAWGPEDFGAAAALFAVMWLAVEAISRLTGKPAIKATAIAAVAALLLLTWAHLAVGVL